MDLVKYILSNSINENLNIHSVDKWYLYNTKKDLYNEIRSDENRLNLELSNNYTNFQNEVLLISKNLKQNQYYFDKLIRFPDFQNSFKSSELLNDNSYFIVDSSLKDSYESVCRYYIKNNSLKDSEFLLSKRIDMAYVRYIFDILDVRLNSLKKGFIENINSLNLDIDVFISIKEIKFFDLNGKEIK